MAQLIAIASPLGGHSAAHRAKRAPVVMPSGRDLDPAGEFIRQLHQRPLREGTQYHLFSTAGEAPTPVGEEWGDGVVPRASQLTPAARAEAFAQVE